MLRKPWQFIDKTDTLVACSWCQQEHGQQPNRSDVRHSICPYHAREVMAGKWESPKAISVGRAIGRIDGIFNTATTEGFLVLDALKETHKRISGSNKRVG